MKQHGRRGVVCRRQIDPTRILPLMLLRVGLAGCQRSTHYPTRDTPDAGFGSTQIAIATDDCPALVVIASPRQARIGDTIAVTGAGRRRERRHQWCDLRLDRQAGEFASAEAAETTYTCPGRDHAGPQTISLTVSDGICATTQSMAVFCYALADGGGPATTEGIAGSAGDAGAGCAPNSATTCEGDACNDCTNGSCQTLAASVVTASFPPQGATSFRRTSNSRNARRCTGACATAAAFKTAIPRGWCGSLDAERCMTGAEPGNAPCLSQIAAAAGSSEAAVIESRLTDARFPIGGAINLATCRSIYCSRLSDPPTSACVL